jgi:hypothetical protein
MHFIKQSTAGFLLAMFTLASISHVPIARAADALPKQGSYSLTFPWHFKGQNHQVSETENFGIGLAWGPSLSDGKRGGFLDEAAVMSMYTVKFAKDGTARNGGHLVVTDVEGHKAFAAWEGKHVPGAEWEEGSMTWTGGTGKYQGMTGQGKWKQKLTGFRADGAEAEGEGYAVWKGDYRLP